MAQLMHKPLLSLATGARTPTHVGKASVSQNISSNSICQRTVSARPFVPSLTFCVQTRPQKGVVCQGLFGLGLPELAVIAGVAALIWGPSKLPELGKGLGQTVKSFQGAAKEFEKELKAATADDTTASNKTEEKVKKTDS